ncbi:MAG TPA: hypothetical protein VEA80_16560 [Vitreimonas sp.]|uniref:hypothetical protein n=1 Tax=Vitreimonas sp. TaxID=3069702 RepID=UPI002D2FDA32|nr:hypothetical protein [Vitreimonas sp.]HYD89091.1 hypothetical protein [Vitreimonas sp.]
MQGWPIALFAATGASGVLAFGIIQSAYSQQAQALFYVFGAVLLGTLAAKKFLGGGGHGHAAHGGGHAAPDHGSDHAVVMSGRLVGAMMIGAAALAGVYFWTDNELTAEKVGRQIDGGVASIGRQVEATYVALRDDARRDEERTAQN